MVTRPLVAPGSISCHHDDNLLPCAPRRATRQFARTTGSTASTFCFRPPSPKSLSFKFNFKFNVVLNQKVATFRQESGAAAAGNHARAIARGRFRLSLPVMAFTMTRRRSSSMQAARASAAGTVPVPESLPRPRAGWSERQQIDTKKTKA